MSKYKHPSWNLEQWSVLWPTLKTKETNFKISDCSNDFKKLYQSDKDIIAVMTTDDAPRQVSLRSIRKFSERLDCWMMDDYVEQQMMLPPSPSGFHRAIAYEIENNISLSLDNGCIATILLNLRPLDLLEALRIIPEEKLEKDWQLIYFSMLNDEIKYNKILNKNKELSQTETIIENDIDGNDVRETLSEDLTKCITNNNNNFNEELKDVIIEDNNNTSTVIITNQVFDGLEIITNQDSSEEETNEVIEVERSDNISSEEKTTKKADKFFNIEFSQEQKKCGLKIVSWVEEVNKLSNLPLKKEAFDGLIKKDLMNSKGYGQYAANYWLTDIALMGIVTLEKEQMEEVMILWPNREFTFNDPNKFLENKNFWRLIKNMKSPERVYFMESVLPKVVNTERWDNELKLNLLKIMSNGVNKPFVLLPRIKLWMSWGGDIDAEINLPNKKVSDFVPPPVTSARKYLEENVSEVWDQIKERFPVKNKENKMRF